MIDTGATGYAFIDFSFTQEHLLELYPTKPRRLQVIDGRPSSAGDITQAVKADLSISSHVEPEMPLFVTKLGRFPIVLGMPWLRQHNPYINFAENYLSFNSTYCYNHCLHSGIRQLCVKGVEESSLDIPTIYAAATGDHSPSRPFKDSPRKRVAFSDSPPTFIEPSSQLPLPPLPNLKKLPHTTVWSKPKTTKPITSIPSPPGQGKPVLIGAAAFFTLANQEAVEIDALTLEEVCYRLKELGHKEDIPKDEELRPPSPHRPKSHYSGINQMNEELKLSSLQDDLEDFKPKNEDDHLHAAALALYGTFSPEDVAKALGDKVHTDPKTKLPDRWWHHLELFDRKEANKLPPHRDCDLKIELKEGATPPFGPMYSMSREELLVLRKFLEDNLKKGFIRPSNSPCASPVLFARKPGGGLRFCVDYRALNALTVKNRYPLPLLQETLSRLSKAKYFTKVDVIAAFNNLRIADGHEYLTAFRTRYGLYETLVVNFGMTNAPAAWQTRINEILRPFLDVFCTAYIDDILIYSDTLEEHYEHVEQVFCALKAAGLHLDIDKCEFVKQEVTYLGMIISTDGVKMDPAKVKTILEWEISSCVKDVQGFLGFANFYRRFIHGFSRIVAPLVHLTKKGAPFDFNDRCKAAFRKLQLAFTTAPILRHFDPSRKVFIETDASDYVSAGILSQHDDAGVLCPVAFFSKKHSPAECNYEIYDKELLAIIRAFEEWRPETEGAAYPITVLSDHRNLEYFMSTKDLSRRQVRWSEFLSRFDWQLKFRPGKDGGKPDALTRRSQDLPADSTDPRVILNRQTVIKSHNLPYFDFKKLDFEQELKLNASILEEHDEEPDSLRIARLLTEYYDADPFAQEIIRLVKKGGQHSRKIALSECAIKQNEQGQDRLYFRDRLYVPGVPKSKEAKANELRVLLMNLAHQQPAAGHYGIGKYRELISRDYFWPDLHADLTRYLANCDLCNAHNSGRRRYGTLKPLPLPSHRWSDVTVDFIGPLPPSGGFDCIMVTVDRLSKMRHYSACHTTDDAADLAKLFCRDVWKLHGLPCTIVSDRGATFVSEFWKAVQHRLGVKQALSTAYHPQSDGQTENANQFLEQYLRKYISFTQEDWELWLCLAEFAANNAMNESTKMSPFFANYGFHPRMSFHLPRREPEENASAHIREQNLQGNTFADRMAEIHDKLRDNLIQSQAKQEEFANRRRVPAPAYQAGDRVWLNARNLKSDRQIKKLDKRFYGPYPIKRTWSHFVEVELDSELRDLGIHNKFHVDLLKPARCNPHPGQINPSRAPIAIDQEGQILYKFETILDSQPNRDGEFKYLVKWEGYSEEEATWEPLAEIVHLRNSILDYQNRRPRKTRPSKEAIAAAKELRKRRTSGQSD